MSRIGSTLFIFNRVVFGSTLSVLDHAQLGPAVFSLRYSERFDESLSVLDATVLGSARTVIDEKSVEMRGLQ